MLFSLFLRFIFSFSFSFFFPLSHNHLLANFFLLKKAGGDIAFQAKNGDFFALEVDYTQRKRVLRVFDFVKTEEGEKKQMKSFNLFPHTTSLDLVRLLFIIFCLITLNRILMIPTPFEFHNNPEFHLSLCPQTDKQQEK